MTLPERGAEAPKALQVLYEGDVVGEALMLAWYHKAGAGGVLEVPGEAAARVRKAAKPFIDFLEQDTESESGSEEE